MSKKDEAFELFSQGKTPDSSEVVALGLAKSSNKRYYRLWKEVQVVKEVVKAPVVPQGVAVSLIVTGANFEHKGKLYQKRNSTLTTVSGLDLKETKRIQQMRWKGFPASTLVIAK